MKPQMRILDEDLISRIVGEARELLLRLGVEIRNVEVLELLADHGGRIDFDKMRAFFPETLIEKALDSVPRSFKLYDSLGQQTHDFGKAKTYFTPGSSGMHILDSDEGTIRRAQARDCVQLAKVVSQLPFIASQSTSMVADDVPDAIADSYRLFLALLFGEKPVVTGVFAAESFELMKDLLLAVRGTAEELKSKPLAIFTCCPTSPLRWCEVNSTNLVDCARSGVPAELMSMALPGFISPVTLTGSLVLHTAESLSGIVISQLAEPGAPLSYGGSSAPFDIRFETTPMGSVESMMMSCGHSEIGHWLGLPTQAYISLSDAKQLDAQAGLETAMGATMAVLSGINQVSGPGMLELENCQSLEKLVVDNEICGTLARLSQGIVAREDFPALPIFQEVLQEQHLVIADHTRKYLAQEYRIPGPVIDRSSLTRWAEKGSSTLLDRARGEVEKLLKDYVPSRLSSETKQDLIQRMGSSARKAGLSGLPGVD